MRNYIKYLLEKNERTAAWLSRKLNISHTLVHSWIKKERNLNPVHFKQTLKIFNVSEEKALKEMDMFD